jgi:TonB family protein
MKALFLPLACTFFVLAIFLTPASAQVPATKTINGGVLNSKAIDLPKPEYPAGLREAGIEGVVAVNITIDEGGNIVAADAEINDQRVRKAADGTVLDPVPVDAQLRQAAEDAARQAKFSPTLLSGQPVRVKGMIVYSFVAHEMKLINGGVLNGKATSLPLPEYPAAARAVNASGSVSVRVTIDEDGAVTDAEAVSGHPLLRRAAVDAAKQARLTPTKLDGKPVKITGVLIYNFVPATKENQ